MSAVFPVSELAPGCEAALAKARMFAVDPATRLLQDLGCCMEIMCARAARQMELIGAECISLLCDPLRGFLNQRQIPAGDLARLRARELIDQDHFRTKGSHHACPFG